MRTVPSVTQPKLSSDRVWLFKSCPEHFGWSHQFPPPLYGVLSRQNEALCGTRRHESDQAVVKELAFMFLVEVLSSGLGHAQVLASDNEEFVVNDHLSNCPHCEGMLD